MSVKWSRTPADATARPLELAMRANPALRVLAACGEYDLICPVDANEYAVRQLPADLRPRVTARGYGGGHALYTDPGARAAFKRDVAAFFRGH